MRYKVTLTVVFPGFQATSIADAASRAPNTVSRAWQNDLLAPPDCPAIYVTAVEENPDNVW